MSGVKIIPVDEMENGYKVMELYNEIKRIDSSVAERMSAGIEEIMERPAFSEKESPELRATRSALIGLRLKRKPWIGGWPQGILDAWEMFRDPKFKNVRTALRTRCLGGDGTLADFLNPQAAQQRARPSRLVFAGGMQAVGYRPSVMQVRQERHDAVAGDGLDATSDAALVATGATTDPSPL